MSRLLALPLILLAACATPAVDAVQERLDQGTGTTVTRLASPVELLATAPRARNADPYAWLAPFETNRMGERHAYLWVAMPGDGAAIVECGALRADVSGAATPPANYGLSRLPYRSPAEWYVVRAIPIDAAWVACLAEDPALALIVGEDRFTGDGARAGDLAQFARRLRE